MAIFHVFFRVMRILLMRRMKFFGKLTKILICFLFFLSLMPLSIFRETLPLNSPGRVKIGDFFLRILNTIGEWAE